MVAVGTRVGKLTVYQGLNFIRQSKTDFNTDIRTEVRRAIAGWRFFPPQVPSAISCASPQVFLGAAASLIPIQHMDHTNFL